MSGRLLAWERCVCCAQAGAQGRRCIHPALCLQAKQALHRQPCRSPEGKPSKESSAGSESGESADVEAAAAAQELQQAPHGATPTRLQTFRNSRLWKALTHGLNQDIHKVGGKGQRAVWGGEPGIV